MRLSQRINQIQPSATLAMNALTQKLRDQGKEVISLAVGQPDFSTPDHVCAAAHAAIDQGFTRYTAVPGIQELRTAVAGYFKRFYNVNAGADNVVVTNGGKQSLFNLFQCLLDPGDEVLLPAPYWVSYPAMIQLAQGRSVIVPTEPDEDFLVSVEALEAHRTDATRMLVLNTPSNPTGCHYPRERVDEIAQWAVDHDIFVISDEIYDQLVYAPGKPVSLSTWWEKHPERFAVVNGLAKSFAMTGWRIGYTLAGDSLIKALSKIQSQCTSNICSIAQKAALAALTGPWEPVVMMREAFAVRRNMALEHVRSWPHVVCPAPVGAFYLFPKVDHYYNDEVRDSTALCAYILEKAGVALVPGAAFGDDRCVRISYALDEATILLALDKIRDVLTSLG
ncbi:pyridoxal phosphate-dependent aminotransferase [Desulfoplanes formicivorans]|uniref:Aminotransferase n=1 Tax=Desulfoplanes formicivorans TaxID=1592317 RepID=A0A194AHP0_9BACT|nr:pyridoxal phosphate-dependent aminotransferase [Desulfoplanes formicivorans]GAU08596.1 aspartate aminotransferase [Desulfoplanes formicivorans]